MKTITPILDRVLILQDEAQEKIGSFIVPDSVKEKPCQGTVIAIGEEVKHIKADYRVLYFKHAGTNITVDGKELMIMKYADLIAIL